MARVSDAYKWTRILIQVAIVVTVLGMIACLAEYLAADVYDDNTLKAMQAELQRRFYGRAGIGLVIVLAFLSWMQSMLVWSEENAEQTATLIASMEQVANLLKRNSDR